MASVSCKLYNNDDEGEFVRHLASNEYKTLVLSVVLMENYGGIKDAIFKLLTLSSAVFHCLDLLKWIFNFDNIYIIFQTLNCFPLKLGEIKISQILYLSKLITKCTHILIKS